MKKMDESGERLLGYRVITQSLILGKRVYKRGEFITAKEANKELDYSEGFGLVTAIYEGDEDDWDENEKPSKGKRSLLSSLAFKKS